MQNIENAEKYTEERIAKTQFVVEANGFERRVLYYQWSQKINWKDESFGIVKEISRVDNRPINIEINWALIEGRRVMFWYPCSELVDHQLIKQWFKDNCSPTWDNNSREAFCDAMNFRTCLDFVKNE